MGEEWLTLQKSLKEKLSEAEKELYRDLLLRKGIEISDDGGKLSLPKDFLEKVFHAISIAQNLCEQTGEGEAEDFFLILSLLIATEILEGKSLKPPFYFEELKSSPKEIGKLTNFLYPYIPIIFTMVSGDCECGDCECEEIEVGGRNLGPKFLSPSPGRPFTRPPKFFK
ncbi:MAG: hypothetical protein QW356_07080 [Candidatus Hadarchaeales archaeon]